MFRRSVCLDDEHKARIDNECLNLSKFVNRKLDEHFKLSNLASAGQAQKREADHSVIEGTRNA